MWGWGWIRRTRGVENKSACRLVWCEAGGALVVYAVVCVQRHDTVGNELIVLADVVTVGISVFLLLFSRMWWKYSGVIGNGSVPEFTSRGVVIDRSSSECGGYRDILRGFC